MSAIRDFLVSLGIIKPKDYRTREEIIDDLKKDAEAAELLAAQTKEAFELKKRIVLTENERQKVLTLSGGTVKKGPQGLQTIVIVVFVVVVFAVLIKSC